MQELLTIRAAAAAFKLGLLVNAWPFHCQMAHAAMVGPPGTVYGSRHNKAANHSFVAMKRTIDQSSLEDPESYTAIVRDAERRWRDLNVDGDYFHDRARSVVATFEATEGERSAAEYLTRWMNDDISPIAEELRRGLRNSLPAKLRPYFDLGHSFDQGWRRPDAYCYVQQAVGRPISASYYGDVWWPYCGPFGPLEDKLTELVDQITAADDVSAEEEGEIDLSGKSAANLPTENYVASFDVPPGALTPEPEWFTTIRDRCRKLDLKVGGKVTELRNACNRALRGEIYREEWLLELAGFRRELLTELAMKVLPGEQPWASWDRDHWLFCKKQKGCTLKQLEAKLKAEVKVHESWWIIGTTQISAAIARVKSHLGIADKRKRGRPKKRR